MYSDSGARIKDHSWYGVYVFKKHYCMFPILIIGIIFYNNNYITECSCGQTIGLKQRFGISMLN